MVLDKRNISLHKTVTAAAAWRHRSLLLEGSDIGTADVGDGGGGVGQGLEALDTTTLQKLAMLQKV